MSEHETCDQSRRKLLKRAYIAPTVVALGGLVLTTNLNGSSSLCHSNWGNNGWGNGDQQAPGRSRFHNRAENDRGHKFHHKHGQSHND